MSGCVQLLLAKEREAYIVVLGEAKAGIVGSQMSILFQVEAGWRNSRHTYITCQPAAPKHRPKQDLLATERGMVSRQRKDQHTDKNHSRVAQALAQSS